MYNKKFMIEAIALSRQCLETGLGGPFGAVVVKDEKIVGQGRNMVTLNNDPTAHAEITAIRDACKNLGSFQLTDCEIYTSCEPCPMCLGAIYWARPAIVYYAACQKDAAKAGFDDSFIYKEFNLSPPERAIPAMQFDREKAVAIFDEWILWNDKVKY